MNQRIKNDYHNLYKAHKNMNKKVNKKIPNREWKNFTNKSRIKKQNTRNIKI
jgi:phage terminase small subunit